MMIGLDFDNTLASYDGLLHREARARRLIPASTPKDKKEIRDAIRRGPGGDLAWQKLQALVYGPLMGEAVLIDGVAEFLAACRAAKIRVRIVSHKARRYRHDETGTDFQAAALRWMTRQGFFSKLGLDRGSVYFEDTRAAKVARIKNLGCTHFVDDLEETFAEPGFPKGVERLLFSPRGAVPPKGVRAFGSWARLRSHLLAPRPAAALSRLLGRAPGGLRELPGGRNSRVYRFAHEGRELVGKFYFRHAGDPRDRLGTEFAAFDFLWSRGLRRTPQPVAKDAEAGVAVYERLEGRPIARGAATPSDVEDALGFLNELNALRGPAARAAFGPASEAYFSPAGVAANVRARLARLNTSKPPAKLSRLLKKLEALLDRTERACARAGVLNEVLPAGERLLSPSDFGFHNAVHGRAGLRFFDFEYFGWDDPAKTFSDFVLHPAMALDAKSRSAFAKGFLARFSTPSLRRRLPCLYTLFGLKWCAILLNEFVPEHRQRREFARGEAAQDEQLAKASALLARVTRETENFPYA